MPSQRQKMMIDTIDSTSSGLGKSDTARLISAYGKHSKSIVASKDDPGTSADFEIAEGSEKISTSLKRSDYRKTYAEEVKAGSKHIPGSEFPEAGDSSANLSYGGAPELGTPTPEGETAPGTAGSTIVASGLGPNVNIHGTLGVGGTREVVDGSTTASSTVYDPHHSGDGRKSPHTESTTISAETSLPPGTLGSSTAGLPEPGDL